jgi:protein-S-isoprenylcysteine O-methyltransferase Ste14
MQKGSYEYGMWPIATFMILFFTMFVISFFRPAKKREWRNLGIFEAFIVALYAEMYGFPLTIYILSAFFGVKVPFLHIKGHLWASLFNLPDKWAMVICNIGSLFMLTGLIIMGIGWRKIYKGEGELVTDSLYRYIRHPQYLGLMLITSGMLIQWPTILTIIMWPILIFAYWHLAKIEEREMEEKFGQCYFDYKRQTGMFFPNIKNLKSEAR